MSNGMACFRVVMVIFFFSTKTRLTRMAWVSWACMCVWGGGGGVGGGGGGGGVGWGEDRRLASVAQVGSCHESVSYTHLTLPTNREV